MLKILDFERFLRWLSIVLRTRAVEESLGIKSAPLKGKRSFMTSHKHKRKAGTEFSQVSFGKIPLNLAAN